MPKSVLVVDGKRYQVHVSVLSGAVGGRLITIDEKGRIHVSGGGDDPRLGSTLRGAIGRLQRSAEAVAKALSRG